MKSVSVPVASVLVIILLVCSSGKCVLHLAITGSVQVACVTDGGNWFSASGK